MFIRNRQRILSYIEINGASREMGKDLCLEPYELEEIYKIIQPSEIWTALRINMLSKEVQNER